MHNLLLAVVILLWILLGVKYQADWSSCCSKEAISDTSRAPASESAGQDGEVACPDVPICFLDNQSTPSYGSEFDSYRDSIVSLVGDGQKLRIIGLYNSTEENTSSAQNLGLGRAESIRSQFISKLNPDQIETASQMTVGQSGASEGYSTTPVSFSVVGEEAETIPMGTIIYFAFNSTDKLDDSVVEAYLDSVVKRVSDSGERVQVVGHTDNLGNEATNSELGRQRAQVIRDYLVDQGLTSTRIRIESKGESQPVASNATEEGRARNRRAELRIIN